MKKETLISIIIAITFLTVSTSVVYAACSNYKCSKNNCGGELEWSAKAYQEQAGTCNQCGGDGLMDVVNSNGTITPDGKSCNISNCNSGTLYEWKQGCKCKKCGTGYVNK